MCTPTSECSTLSDGIAHQPGSVGDRQGMFLLNLVAFRTINLCIAGHISFVAAGMIFLCLLALALSVLHCCADEGAGYGGLAAFAFKCDSMIILSV